MNENGEISPEFKALLVKMLAINPCKRVGLDEILKSDEWVGQGPQGSMMSVDDYQSAMSKIH